MSPRSEAKGGARFVVFDPPEAAPAGPDAEVSSFGSAGAAGTTRATRAGLSLREAGDVIQ